MKQYEVKDSGFSVLHNSGAWRLAAHVYDPRVNSLSAVNTWGRHLDSEEAFVLLAGEAWLFEREEDGTLSVRELRPENVYLVEAGVRHAIVLREGAAVFIAENRDMDNSVTESMMPEEKREIEKICAD